MAESSSWDRDHRMACKANSVYSLVLGRKFSDPCPVVVGMVAGVPTWQLASLLLWQEGMEGIQVFHLELAPEWEGVRGTPAHPSLQQLRHPCLLLIPVNVEAQALALNP